MRTQLALDGQWQDVPAPDDCTGWRSSPVFAALADLRNAYGVPPIAPARGLPEDLTRAGETDPALDCDWIHGTSWLTLAELQAYDWHSPAWHQLIPAIGGPVPLTQMTAHFRETVLPALASLGSPEEVRIVFTFDG